MKPPIVPPDLHEYDLQRLGYVTLNVKGGQAVALGWAAEAVGQILNNSTLHDWAARQPQREEMRGRVVIYSVLLPTTPVTPIVVRRNRHGGLLRAVTGDCFRFPTRAPYELATALRLASGGIPTPEVVAYAIYPAGMFARSDVVTRRLPEGNDFPVAWQGTDGAGRNFLLTAVARLLTALDRAGAWHADLNLKNIYMAGQGPEVSAYLLDVDRVTFPDGVDIAGSNFKRLARSARKWRDKWGLDFDEDALAQLAALSLENK